VVDIIECLSFLQHPKRKPEAFNRLGAIIFMVTLAAALLVLLAGCGNYGIEPPTQPQPQPQPSVPPTGEEEPVVNPEEWEEAYSVLINAFMDYENSGFQVFDEELLGGTMLTSDYRFNGSMAGIGFEL